MTTTWHIGWYPPCLLISLRQHLSRAHTVTWSPGTAVSGLTRACRTPPGPQIPVSGLLLLQPLTQAPAALPKIHQAVSHFGPHVENSCSSSRTPIQSPLFCEGPQCPVTFRVSLPACLGPSEKHPKPYTVVSVPAPTPRRAWSPRSPHAVGGVVSSGTHPS